MNKRLFLYLLLPLSALLLVACGNQRHQPAPPNPIVLNENAKYDPKSAAESNTELGINYMRQGRYAVALDKLNKALEQDSKNPMAHTAMALLNEHLGKKTEVEPHYKKALSLEPDNSATHNNYAAFLCSQGRMAEAETHFQTALANPLYKTPELAYTNAGLCAVRFNKRNKAMDYFRKALQHNPNIARALYQMAELYEEQGAFTEAQAYYRRYIAIASQTPQSLWLGVRIARALNDKDAEASYALQLKSRYPEANETYQLKQSEQIYY
ncbi:type IV pilus biogenesis/stability protein PilW [Candidatus Venteria ishoeyi]|uniref:type IV pilus biogenesis/stability protein PilW n=1 Tax=Candidatus Venteria ishoeyi TaxID=1899563 RepID=UPI0025A67D70|nr:type IV pilus biogenesis/stability protein PilW [Candidatus Venteria ishoeyi]MDM8544892.1 type IV pilus biogenesis/stability protein PilW [Candidatus Venteria ishoeyi]